MATSTKIALKEKKKENKALREQIDSFSVRDGGVMVGGAIADGVARGVTGGKLVSNLVGGASLAYGVIKGHRDAGNFGVGVIARNISERSEAATVTAKDKMKANQAKGDEQ